MNKLGSIHTHQSNNTDKGKYIYFGINMTMTFRLTVLCNTQRTKRSTPLNGKNPQNIIKKAKTYNTPYIEVETIHKKCCKIILHF